MSSKKLLNAIYSILYQTKILSIVMFVKILTTPCRLDASTPNLNTENYVNFPSWIYYLHKHPGYQSYQPPNNIKKHGAKWGTWVTFPQKIEAIQARVGSIQNPEDLFLSQDFLAMYKHPDNYYLQPVLDYLASEKYSVRQKEIALYTISRKHILSIEDYYQLYKCEKIDLDLLELSFSICIVNHDRFTCNKSKKASEILNNIPILNGNLLNFLHKVMQEVPKNSSISNNFKLLFSSDVFPQSWYKKILLKSGSGYYKSLLPFLEVIHYAEMERKGSEMMIFGDFFHGLETPPYFLMIMEHPIPYYLSYFNESKDIQNGIRILRDPIFSSEEKSMAIFGISQLCVSSSNEAAIYASFIDSACEWYRKGQLSVGHLYQLFICNLPSVYQHCFTTFYKYPFFILDYKDKSVQESLDKFMAEPTIPDGLKAIAGKVKNGTLATKEEMIYMEGYRKFRKKYFTLYETIPPRRPNENNRAF